MAEKSKILVIGGTVLKPAIQLLHLVRESTASNPEKSQLFDSFKRSGVTLRYGNIYDHNSLVKAIKKVDIVISCVGLSS
ncbi:Hopanoid-associated sugar epimerase [Parasponia andersonii]|uniref:Hopanoid-associated sugar epimerase n=1 Tax=Parasponia andersonii TaxID=3476 RepID=A0A2P5DDP4_PARAD|nr:Hopanoid-associated sugar epimerase [Parasponia andersonii]